MSEEIRTTSSTGGQKGVKPQRFSLLPTPGLAAIAEVFGFGATKYADHNWRKGYEWSKSYDALQRHITAFWDGETYDEESKLEHLAHAGFHVLVLLTWLRQDGEGSKFDDRHTNSPALQDYVNVMVAHLADVAALYPCSTEERHLAEAEIAADEESDPSTPYIPFGRRRPFADGRCRSVVGESPLRHLEDVGGAE